MTENEEFIFESIYNQIRMGFLSIEEIKENIIEEIEDNEFEEEMSKEWAYKIIREEYEMLVTESKNWKKPTDTEKLIKAFNELCKTNIIALHNAGYTTSDGEGEVAEVETELIERGKKPDGYCFYHEQDLARAIVPENPSLMIAFQKINNSDDKTTVEIGKRVVEILKKNGFQINWNQSATTKIEIPNFSWKKLYDDSSEDLLDYQKVIEIMTN